MFNIVLICINMRYSCICVKLFCKILCCSKNKSPSVTYIYRMLFSDLDSGAAFFYFSVIMQVGQQMNSKVEVFYRASRRQRFVAGLVFLGVAGLFGLLWLAAHYRIIPWPTICGFEQRHGLPCPTCGFTTSAIAFAQGKIFESFYIQPAGALLCCILAVSGFLALLIAVFGVYSGYLERFFAEVKIKYIILALIIIIAGGWAVTLARVAAVRN